MREEEMALQGAVLIIGCLFWEDETTAPEPTLGRAKRLWRERELDMASAKKWPAPIRYGMQSMRRWQTYTMVFSTSAPLGTAQLVPYAEAISQPEELIRQARRLGIVEGYDPRRGLWTEWGTVGIRWSPTTDENWQPFFTAWEEAYADFKGAASYGMDGEESCVNEKGELLFELDFPDGIDYILATPNVPNVSEYPEPEDIRKAILASPEQYDTYVQKNIEYGIRVPGDERILPKQD